MKKDEDIKPEATTSTSEDTLGNVTEKSIDESASQSSTMASPGAILKKAREAKGLTVKEVAAQLKLKIDIVQHLEDDSLDDNLHTPTFVRGYLCSYAKLLNIPAEDVSAVYDLSHDAKQSYDVHIQTFSQETTIRTSNGRITVVTWILVICLIVLSAAWWWQNREETVLTDMTSVELDVKEEGNGDLTQTLTVMSDEGENEIAIVNRDEESVVEESAVSVDVQSQAEVKPVPQQEKQVQKPEAKPEPKKEVTPKAEKVKTQKSVEKQEKQSVAQKVQATKEYSGQVVFNGDCWINIRGADGKSLINGVRKAGSTANFTGVAPFKVVLGAPSNVELTYEGKEVDLSVFSKKGKVARLTLGE